MGGILLNLFLKMLSDFVRSWPLPKSLTELSFVGVRPLVGVLQLFRRFMGDSSGITAPLTSLTEK